MYGIIQLKGEQTPKTSFVIGIGENQLIGAGAYK